MALFNYLKDSNGLNSTGTASALGYTVEYT